MPQRSREERLDQILGALGPWELLHVKHQAARYLQLASRVFTDLPPELIVCICEYLEDEDVQNASMVSKGWRSTWLQPIVASFLCKRSFPGWLESWSDSSCSIGELFLRAVADGTREFPDDSLLHGDESRSALFHLCRPGNGGALGDRLNTQPVLNQGKLAWVGVAGPPYPLYVYDLASGVVQRLALDLAPRTLITLVTVSSKLIVLDCLSLAENQTM
jgi:hypothetical protein